MLTSLLFDELSKMEIQAFSTRITFTGHARTTSDARRFLAADCVGPFACILPFPSHKPYGFPPSFTDLSSAEAPVSFSQSGYSTPRRSNIQFSLHRSGSFDHIFRTSAVVISPTSFAVPSLPESSNLPRFLCLPSVFPRALGEQVLCRMLR